MQRFLFAVFLNVLLFAATATRSQITSNTIKVGIAGTSPFIVDTPSKTGISLEIWEALADRMNWQYQEVYFGDVPQALRALEEGKINAVAGPVSITSDRAERVSFTQPYFQSSLSILSRTGETSFWKRIKPYFTARFFLMLFIFIGTLAVIGSILWIAEHKSNDKEFPKQPVRGIANGMWCAVVTMTTTGYGDVAPKTFWGRFVAGVWMIISLGFATTLIAGVSSTLTLSKLSGTSIQTVEELAGKKVATVPGSPAETFVRTHGGINVSVLSLQQGYELLKEKKADAVVYDRPQLLYLLQQTHDRSITASEAEYEREGYGFAFPVTDTSLHDININLLELQETGVINSIISNWLGNEGVK